MVGQGRMLLGIAALSAILAAFVPGVMETRAGEVVQVQSMAERPVARDAVRADVAIDAPTSRAEQRTAVVPRPVRSTRVPIGCERSVSPLVRSAAASQLSRCLT